MYKYQVSTDYYVIILSLILITFFLTKKLTDYTLGELNHKTIQILSMKVLRIVIGVFWICLCYDIDILNK